MDLGFSLSAGARQLIQPITHVYNYLLIVTVSYVSRHLHTYHICMIRVNLQTQRYMNVVMYVRNEKYYQNDNILIYTL